MAVSDELTLRRLNRATLARQLLLRREPLDVVDAVRRIVAIQAQEPASTHLALWNRVDRFDGDHLHDAFVDGRVVKATLMRITLHAVTADDHAHFHGALVPSLRASRLHDRRFAESGLSVDEVDELVPEALAHLGAAPRTNADMESWLEARLGRPAPRAWWAMRTFAPVAHAPTGGSWSHGTKPAYLPAPSPPSPQDHEASVVHLVRRYLDGFGPATAQDIAQFTILRMPAVSAALEALAGELDVLPAVLVDGFVAGVWRTVGDGVEITAFDHLHDGAWAGLAVEAERLLAFLADRDPTPYRRYARWWSDLPAAEVRIVPA